MNSIKKEKRYFCKFCKKKFGSHFNTKRHEDICGYNINPRKIKPNGGGTTLTQCYKCGKVYGDITYISRHTESCNGVFRRRTLQCLHDDCIRTFYHKKSLLKHLREEHTVAVQEKYVLEFSNHEDFELWKNAEENKTFSHFTKRKGSIKNVSFYYCQRDGPGHANSNPEYLKRKSMKGRMRSGMTCLAYIRAELHDDGHLTVHYVPTHSHSASPLDLKHIPSQENDEINQLLSEGKTPEEITTSLIENYGESLLSRTNYPNLLSRIRERARRIRIKSRRDEDEYSALIKIKEELQNEDYCPIILYKIPKQEIEIGKDVENENYDLEDTLLIGIQTKSQIEKLKTYEKGVICVDVLDIAKNYQVLSLVIPNELNQGFPVGFCISNIVNEDVVACFATAVRRNVGAFKINYVISQDNSILFNGFKKGFSSELEHIICIWEFQRSFEEDISKLNPGKSLDLEIDVLYNLINTTSENEFDNLLVILRSLLFEIEPNFLEFLDIHIMKSHQWAMWCRYFTNGVDTTLSCEGVRNFLKYTCMQNIQTERLDDIVCILLKMEDILEDKRNCSRSINERVNCKHARGIKIPNNQIRVLVPGKHYLVKSQLYKQHDYKIMRLQEDCFLVECHQVCNSIFCSRLCQHMYYCTCEDLVNICEHIHKVHSLNSQYLEGMLFEEEDVEIIELKFTSDVEQRL